MARRFNQGIKFPAGVGVTYTVGSGIGDTAGTNLYDAISAATFRGAGANQWSLSTSSTAPNKGYRFGSGTTERCYFVLTHNTSGAEILFLWNNGTAVSYDSSVVSTYRDSTVASANQLFGMAYSPLGGYNTSFAAGRDPVNANFWNHNANVSASSLVHPMVGTQNGQSGNLFFIADDSKANFYAFVRVSGGSAQAGGLLFGDELFDNSFDSPSPIVKKGTFTCTGGTNSATTIADANTNFTIYNSSNVPTFVTNDVEAASILTGITDANQPSLDNSQVQAATTAALTGTGLAYSATGGASGRGQFTWTSGNGPTTIDGVTLANNDRILVKDQATASQNGIFVRTTQDQWDRAPELDADGEAFLGFCVFVQAGTTNANTRYILTTTPPIVVGGGSGSNLTWALVATVRVATTQRVSLSGTTPVYNATGGSSARGQITWTTGPTTLDGVTLAINDRMLLKNEGDTGGLGAAANGIWVRTAANTWDRATDFDADSEAYYGFRTGVTAGTLYTNSHFKLVTANTITLGGASGSLLNWTWAGNWFTTKIPLWTSTAIYGWVDSSVGRIVGRTTTETFKTLKGRDDDLKFLHYFQDLYMPWDNALAPPT